VEVVDSGSETQSEPQNVFERSPLEQELLGRVAWLISLRWMMAVSVFIITAIAGVWFGLELRWVEIVLIGTAILGYNVFLAYRLRSLRRNPAVGLKTFRRFAGLQISLDWLALTLLIYYTGGIQSPLIFYFIFNAIVVSMLFPLRTALVFAASGILLMLGLALIEYFSLLPSVIIPEFDDVHLNRSTYLIGELLFFASVILFATFLVSSISRRLARRTREIGYVQQDLESAYNKTHTLYEIAKSVNSTLNLQQVLDTIVRQATVAMGAKAASIRLLDDDRRYLEVSAAYGLSSEYLTKGKVDPQSSQMDYLALLGQPVAVSDVDVDHRLQYPEEMRQEGIRAVLSVPLSLHESTIGVLRVYASDVRQFKDEEVTFMMALASQGAVAIQNAQAYRHLQELEEAKSRFVFAVTHELKSPVAAVQSQFAILQGGYAGVLSERQRHLIDRAAQRMAALNVLIRDLLALGALKGRLPANQRKPMNLIDIVRQQIELVQPEAEARNIRFDVIMPDEPVIFSTSEDDMERLLGNLLENAVKYTPSGGQAALTLSADGTGVRIIVSDSGIGISPEALPHIFEEFYRAKNAKEMGLEGTGLGLSLVKRILELYCGDITVESRVNEGTRFNIFLPWKSDGRGKKDNPTT
jgi:signal transduction histidine kinase